MNQKREHILSVEDLWEVFRERWKIILLLSLVVIGGMAAAVRLTFVPRYQSTATLYILRRENGGDYTYSSSDFSIALNVVNDCNYLLKSHAVLDQVIESLQLDTDYKALSRSITSRNPSNTRILEVTVETGDLALSKRIVDEVCTVGVQKINEAMGFNQVSFYEYGTLSPEPSNRTRTRTYLIAAVLTALLSYFFFLIFSLLDDRLNTKEEIEHSLGISVIGEIPNFYDQSEAGYGYRRKRYGYRPAEGSASAGKNTESRPTAGTIRKATVTAVSGSKVKQVRRKGRKSGTKRGRKA